MSSLCHHLPFKKSQYRHRRRKLTRHSSATPSTRLIAYLRRYFQTIQLKEQIDSSKSLSSLSATAMEPICQRIASECKTLLSKATTQCPLICLFCEKFISEPLTLLCGHTFCELCVIHEDFHPSTACPRCKKGAAQGPNHLLVDYARKNSTKKNRFLQQLFERCDKLRSICQSNALCRQAQQEFTNENFQKALEMYSTCIESADDHLAYYGRAKVWMALKEPEKALEDIERVVQLKPHWAKGHYYRSAILAEMQQTTAALLSSLQGLALDPEDPVGKQIMAGHLQAVLSRSEEEDRATAMEQDDSVNLSQLIEGLSTDKPPPTESSSSSTSSSSLSSESSSTAAITTADATDHQLMLCQTTKSDPCFCLLFDKKHITARDFDCSICANLLWFPVTTPCGHTFCRECLIRSIDNTQSQCPMCKHSLQEYFSFLLQSHVQQTEIVSEMIQTYFPKEYEERKILHEQEHMQAASIPRTLAEDTETLIFEIPIFVCILALPHLQCPLHVFEPRYRLMMRRAVESESRTFGMCSYDERIENFAEYGTLLYIRGIIYTQDGRSIVDTIGQRRFRVIERDMRDGYCTARVQLIRDDPIANQEEFNELFQLNRTTYDRVRAWFDQLDTYRRTLISRQLESYPTCDDITQSAPDGPSWAWIMLNLLPIEHDLQYTILTSRSIRTRLQIINDTINFLMSHRLRHQQRQQQQEQRQEEQHMEHQQEREQESTPSSDT